MPLDSRFLFFGQFLKNFKTTGAILPSTGALSRALVSPLDPIPGPRRILEAGSGTGTVTDRLIHRLRKDDVLVLCEINSRFADHIESLLLKNPNWKDRRNQIELVRGDVRDVLEKEKFDFIVSGLPFNNFDASFVGEVTRGFLHSLGEGGAITFFEYQGIRGLRSAIGTRKERNRMRGISEELDQALSGWNVDEVMVYANIPPAKVYVVLPRLESKARPPMLT